MAETAMAETATSESRPVVTLPAYRGAQKVTQVAVLRSEWTKLWSLRSTVWSLLTAAALLVVTSLLLTTLKVDNGASSAAARSDFDPAALSLDGVIFAQVAVAVLGLLLFTGEYGTGMIRITFAAVPRRLPVLWGKAGAFALASIAVGTVGALVAFYAGQAILASKHIDITLSQPGVARAVLGAALFLTATGLLALGLGAVVRSTAAGVGSVLGVLLALPIAVDFLPQHLKDRVSEYLPNAAGTAIIYVRPQSYVLPPWTGFGIYCLYVALALALAAWRLRRPDVA